MRKIQDLHKQGIEFTLTGTSRHQISAGRSNKLRKVVISDVIQRVEDSKPSTLRDSVRSSRSYSIEIPESLRRKLPARSASHMSWSAISTLRSSPASFKTFNFSGWKKKKNACDFKDVIYFIAPLLCHEIGFCSKMTIFSPSSKLQPSKRQELVC